MRIYFTTNDDCRKCNGEGFTYLAKFDGTKSNPVRALCDCAIQRVAARFNPTTKEPTP